MSLRALRGMNDILPPDILLWQEVEEKARRLFEQYRYNEIRTPLLEEIGVFTRTIGETTNIVEKEMYVFQDRSGKSVALRPEGTASVVRACIEHNLSAEDPIGRYYYMGPMYRFERPQRGRFRQFYQLGAEILGISSPRLDAEVIAMVDLYLRELGLSDATLEINSLGCTICRPRYVKALFDFLMKNESGLCDDCHRRLEKNPLRVLDCNQEACQQLTNDGPSIQEHLCEDCERDFDCVLTTLGSLGSRYKINAKIVRGLDYYLKTTFEFTSPALGAQNAIAGGGRYDGLVHLMGGPNIPGFGFAIGMERLVEALRETRKGLPPKGRHGVFIAALGDPALTEAIKIAQTLRQAGISVDLDYEGKSLKSQMRRADKTASRTVAILGDDELKKKVVSLRDLDSGKQEEVLIDRLSTTLTRPPFC